MKIELKNCNNIEKAEIEIIENRLNIKYAINGTGKSTIAKAIEIASNDGNLDELIPFKFRVKKIEESEKPKVNGIEKFKKVIVFNGEYINKFTFKPEELLNNSFEIFVKTPEYGKHMEQIEKLIETIKGTFQKSESLNQIIVDLSTFIDSFGKAASGYSAAGALAKGIGNGNKVENIPKGLEEYKDFIQSDKKVPWLGWQIKGLDFSDLSSSCPFCTSAVETNLGKIKKVKEEYDTKAVEHLNNILNVIGNLSKYFSDDTKKRFDELSKKADKLSKEEIEYLLQVKEQAIVLRDKLNNLKSISFFSLKDVDKIIEAMSGYEIKIDYLPYFKSETTIVIIKEISDRLGLVVENAGILQGEVNQQKSSIEKAIKENGTCINSFLINAGYKYQVSIDYEKNEYHLKLRHVDYDKPIQNGDQHLSFGEKNALAIVLFMYECLSKKADCIILDDPISSFDKNKKYAIIDMLFGKNGGLKSKTVLLLTHDFEPVIDMMYTLRRLFSNTVVAAFMEINKGIIDEKEIKKSDIKTFTEICSENINSLDNDILKLIHLRRYYEINDNKGMPYELLSNLFHRRENPYCIGEIDEHIPITPEQIGLASNDIQDKVGKFSYVEMLAEVNDVEKLKSLYQSSSNNYEKLELFRTITGEAEGNNVLRKDINETFHIENDYVMQLNPLKFQTTPYFIIDQCDSEMKNMGN